MNKSEWNDYISCPVCLEQYNDRDREPKTLTCGHSVCKKCLADIIANRSGSHPSSFSAYPPIAQKISAVSCPLCLRHLNITLPLVCSPKRIAELVEQAPTNMSLKSIIGYYSQQQQQECATGGHLPDPNRSPGPGAFTGDTVMTSDLSRPQDNHTAKTVLVSCETPRCVRVALAGAGAQWSRSDFWACLGPDCGNGTFCAGCVCNDHSGHAKVNFTEYLSDQCRWLDVEVQELHSGLEELLSKAHSLLDTLAVFRKDFGDLSVLAGVRLERLAETLKTKTMEYQGFLEQVRALLADVKALWDDNFVVMTSSTTHSEKVDGDRRLKPGAWLTKKTVQELQRRKWALLQDKSRKTSEMSQLLNDVTSGIEGVMDDVTKSEDSTTSPVGIHGPRGLPMGRVANVVGRIEARQGGGLRVEGGALPPGRGSPPMAAGPLTAQRTGVLVVNNRNTAGQSSATATTTYVQRASFATTRFPTCAATSTEQGGIQGLVPADQVMSEVPFDASHASAPGVSNALTRSPNALGLPTSQRVPLSPLGVGGASGNRVDAAQRVTNPILTQQGSQVDAGEAGPSQSSQGLPRPVVYSTATAKSTSVEEERPFQCTLCPEFRYRNKAGLNYHIKYSRGHQKQLPLRDAAGQSEQGTATDRA